MLEHFTEKERERKKRNRRMPSVGKIEDTIIDPKQGCQLNHEQIVNISKGGSNCQLFERISIVDDERKSISK